MAEAASRLTFDERRLATALGRIGEGVVTTDDLGRVASLNRVAEALTGWSAGEAEGRPLEEIFRTVGERTREELPSPFDRAGRLVPGESSILIAKDGRETSIEERSAPIEDDEGRTIGLLVVFRESGPRLSPERDGEEARKQASNVLDSLSEGFVTLDRDWRYTYVNDAAERITGMTRDELLGKNKWELFPETIGTLTETGYRRAADERRTVEFENFYPPWQRWFAYKVSPARDGGIVVVFRDISERKRDDKALAEAKARAEQQARLFDATLSAVNDFVFTLDRDGRFLFANRALLELWGVPAERAIGRTMVDLDYPESTRLRVTASIDRVFESGLPVSDEVPYRTPAGVEGHYEYTLAPVFDASGAVVQAAGSARDTTRRRAAEDAVRRSEQRFRALVTASSDVVYRMSADWSELRQLQGRAFVADTAEPSRTWLQDYIHPADRPHVLEAIAETIRTRGIFELEHRVVRVDGSLGWTFSRAVPILDDRGEVVEWFGTASDVTRRKLAEEEKERLEAESERQKRIYEAALSNTPDLVYVFDLDHRFTYANEALLAMWGRSSEEALGRNCLELGYPRWHAEMHDREIEQVVATRRPIRGEVPFTGTGGRRIYDYIFVPVLGKHGEVVAVAGTTRDVTERKEAEQAIREQAEQLRENDRRKNEFLAMLAHELRNPLAAIGNAVSVTNRTGLQEHIDWSMGVITRQMTHLTRLIDDLLDVSRISRGQIELRREVLELTPVLEGAAATVRPLVDERRHTLTVSIDRGNLWTNADPTRVEQVVVNLLNNAAKYSEDGGLIRLSARNEGDEVAISVEDRGFGIAPEKLPQMFELFAQGDRTLARSEGGLGIGLTVVKKLVELHQGSVTARSEGPGRGSEFTIRLPRAERPADASAGSDVPRASTRRSARILVVDDSVDTARGMSRLLKILGHDVATAHNGPEAIERAREHRPGFVLLDIGLPGMDGYEVALKLRREDCCKDAVIIAISGYGQDEDRRRSKEAGFDHHLIKPVDHDALLSLLSGAGVNPR